MVSTEFDALGKPERASKLRSIAIQAAGLLRRGNRLQGPTTNMLGSSSHYGNRRRLIFRPESRIRDAIWFQANLWQPANYMPLPVMPRRTNSRIQIEGRSSSRERRLASRWPIRLRKKPSRLRCSPASTRWSNEPFAARQLTVPRRWPRGIADLSRHRRHSGSLPQIQVRRGGVWADMRPCYFAAARKAGFIPPSTPFVIGTVGMPRSIRPAISTSSRRCFSRTAAAMSSGTL
jgi:hypothetical protein